MTTLTSTWPDAALTAELAYRRERLQLATRPMWTRWLRGRRTLVAR